MTFWPLPKAPGGWAKNNCAVARPIHVSNSHNKFGWISTNGLGDSVTDRQRRLQSLGRSGYGDCAARGFGDT